MTATVADTLSRMTASLGLTSGNTESDSLFDNTNFTETQQHHHHHQSNTSSSHKLNEDAESEPDYSDAQLTLRALVSTKEAGIIIGKGGKNVADLRDNTGVKAGVSKVVPGVHDRVLTITGGLTAVTMAYTQIAQTFLENPISEVTHTQATLRLLVSHNLMGSIIGRQGLKIKMIQDVSGVRMAASKEMLPQSNERIVEVQGEVSNIQKAVWEIGKCLVEDWERGVGTVLYNPAVRLTPTSTVIAPTTANGVIPAQGAPGNYLRSHRVPRTGNPSLDFDHADPTDADYKTQTISIPADMVGCIIGKGGSKITEIRRSSGSKIAIAKDHDESNERLFTISGAASSNEKALFLIYNQLDIESKRRQET